MSTGADNKSMPNTPEFEAGYERTFGDTKPQRGKWVYDPEQKKLVPIGEYVRPEIALTAPIMVDRFYENARATDGTDIGSRQRHREYMRQHNLTTADDFTQTWAQSEKQRAELRADPATLAGDKERREQIGRTAYELEHRRK